MEVEETEVKESKPRIPLYLAIGLVLVAVLAGAAFLAGRLMNHANAGPAGPQVFAGPDGSQVMAMELKMEAAPELPQTSPEASGVFTRREDKSIYIGTFTGSEGGVAFSASAGGDVTTHTLSIPYDGPVLEVVVTQETTLYRDTTQLDAEQLSSETVQQTVGPGNLDDLSSDSMLTVWGRRIGDRIIADVLLYTQPLMIQAPKKK